MSDTDREDIFQYYEFLAEERFFQKKFKEYSIGKFPKGLSYSNGCLIFTKGKITNKIKVQYDLSEIPYAIEEVIQFLKTYVYRYRKNNDNTIEELNPLDHSIPVDLGTVEKPTVAKKRSNVSKDRAKIIDTLLEYLSGKYLNILMKREYVRDYIDIGFQLKVFSMKSFVYEEDIPTGLEGLKITDGIPHYEYSRKDTDEIVPIPSIPKKFRNFTGKNIMKMSNRYVKDRTNSRLKYPI